MRSPVPAPVVTVAVKETGWPKPEGLGFEARVEVVEFSGVAMPTTSTWSGEFEAVRVGVALAATLISPISV